MWSTFSSPKAKHPVHNKVVPHEEFIYSLNFKYLVKFVGKNFLWKIILLKECKVRVATMTLDHDDTPHSIFNAMSGTCWKVSEVLDFGLKKRNRGLQGCFSL